MNELYMAKIGTYIVSIYNVMIRAVDELLLASIYHYVMLKHPECCQDIHSLLYIGTVRPID